MQNFITADCAEKDMDLNMAQTLRQDGTVRIIESDSGPAGEHSGPAENTNSLKRALQAVIANRALLSYATAISLMCGVTYIVFSPPRFTASSLLIIDLHSHGVLGPAGNATTDINVDSANIESQIEVLKSEHVLLKLVEAEHLVDDPEFALGYLESLTSSVNRWIRSWQVRAPGPTVSKSVAVARALQKMTSAKRIGLTYTVEVGATMANPEQAAKIANAYARAFIADQSARQEESAKRASELLSQRTAELQSQTEESEKAVEDLKYLGSLAGSNSADARVSLQRLESTARTYRLLHDKFLDRYAETWQQRFIALPEAQVVSEAFPPSGKSGPRSTTILALSLLIGFTFGLVLVALRDRKILGLAI